MVRLRRNWLLFLVISVVGFSAFTTDADAAFRLRVESVATATGVVITDDGLGDSAPGVAGQIVFIGGVGGGFAVNVTTGISQPPLAGLPATATAVLDLNSVNIQSLGAGTVEIWLENDFFAGVAGPSRLIAQVGGTLLAPAGSSASFQSWVNPTNAMPALGADTFPAGALAAVGAVPAGSVPGFVPPVVFGPGAFAAADEASFVDTGLFSLFTRATITFTGAGSVTFDEAQIVPVPEPGSLMLILTGLPLVGYGYFWQRRRRS